MRLAIPFIINKGETVSFVGRLDDQFLKKMMISDINQLLSFYGSINDFLPNLVGFID